QSLKFHLKRRNLNGDGKVPFGAAPRAYASALLFVQSRIGFIRRWLDSGALGFAQRSFLVSLSLFFLAPSTCRPRSLGSISSVIWFKCHHVPRWLITHLLALYNHVAMPSPRHVAHQILNDRRIFMSARPPRPAGSFAARSKRWTSGAARPEPKSPQNAQR